MQGMKTRKWNRPRASVKDVKTGSGPARKLARLCRCMERMGSAVVAFSGGLDSSLLASVAVEVLGDRALAVTASSPTYPLREQTAARRLAKTIGIRHRMVESDELKIPGFSDNPPDRCYHCKRELFRVLWEVARAEGIGHVLDGTDADDRSDYRPGRRAAGEANVESPLLAAGLTRADIRILSQARGLPTADKPSLACLASRFPYGHSITAEKLTAVDRVECAVRALGIPHVRVRHHGSIARIEVLPDCFEQLTDAVNRKRIVAAARKAGFSFCAMDLEGYRTGSLNRELSEAVRRSKGR